MPLGGISSGNIRERLGPYLFCSRFYFRKLKVLWGGVAHHFALLDGFGNWTARGGVAYNHMRCAGESRLHLFFVF